jgi:hypothetical protein
MMREFEAHARRVYGRGWETRASPPGSAESIMNTTRLGAAARIHHSELGREGHRYLRPRVRPGDANGAARRVVQNYWPINICLDIPPGR